MRFFWRWLSASFCGTTAIAGTPANLDAPGYVPAAAPVGSGQLLKNMETPGIGGASSSIARRSDEAQTLADKVERHSAAWADREGAVSAEGRGGASKGKVEDVRVLAVHQDYNTVVGEHVAGTFGGRRGGQKARTSTSRALVEPQPTAHLYGVVTALAGGGREH
ncbi:unnamed protein product, partial [Amoebophrya sp. A120]|eukprot:GSA120T00004254001.1